MYRRNLGLFLRSSLPLLAASALMAACGGDDGKVPDSSMGGEPGLEACDRDADCDDSLYCNGEERCVDNACKQGAPVECDDGIKCTVDRCVEDSQECESEAPDNDGDGHLDASCLNADGEAVGDDCNDDDPLSYPGNTEVCDPENRDEDCDPKTFGSLDADRDSYIDAKCCNTDEDGDLNCGDDCDDNKTTVNPAASEACDFLDNNCDGETDEGVSISVYRDKDHDGHGDDEVGTVKSCAGAVGYAVIAGDCDDDDPEVFEGQFEICDDKDNNCNGQADEVRELAPWYKDTDGDGYGDPASTPVLSCYRVPGRVLSQNDCNDGAKAVNPNATEICDGQDNDCNGLADFKLAGNNNFEDDDGDGAADADCGGDDCNDTDPRTSAGAQEVCDRIDNDCDGQVDEQTVQNIWYTDADGDGWGVVIGSALASCDPLPGRASQFGDCDDTKRGVKPGAVELCDGVDQDCDGTIDEGAGVHCHLPNALNTCRFGACAVFSCLPGFVDLNGLAADGCEAAANPADFETATPCITDSECNDANLCNGIETCVSSFCRLGSPIACGAGPSVIQGNFVIEDGRDILDLAGIDLITGDLSINSTLLSSLVGLETLRVIGGNLFIRGNNNLVRLSGSALSNLEVVGGDIIISDNPKLTSASLPSLVSANSLNIVNNDALIELKGFENLANIDRLLHISDNSSLKTISEFKQLGRIGGAHDTFYSCYGTGGLEVQYNDNLLTMDAFGALDRVEGDLCISYNYGLSELVFEKLETVDSSMRIEGAENLEMIEAPELRVVGRDLSVGGGEGEGTLRAISFPSLLEVGEQLSCTGSGASLEELSFPELTEVGGLSINLYSYADELVDVDFSSLEKASSLSLYYSATQVGVPVWIFPSLESVTSSFYIDIYAEVTAVRAPVLKTAGSLSVTVYSDAMQRLDFASLEEVSGYFDVSRSSPDPTAPALNNVDFGSLVRIGVQNAPSATASFSTSTTSLDIGALTTVGDNSSNSSISLFVAPYNVCPDVERILNGGFAGIIYDDFGCNE